jgi:hypothetical protein
MGERGCRPTLDYRLAGLLPTMSSSDAGRPLRVVGAPFGIRFVSCAVLFFMFTLMVGNSSFMFYKVKSSLSLLSY